MEEQAKNPGQPGAIPEVDAETLARCENVLIELSRSLKAVNFYPRGHPTLVSTLEKAHSAFVQALSGAKQLSFSISRDGFTYQSKTVGPNNPNLPPLAREFFLRQIKKIFFLPDLTLNEIENFLRVIAMEEELFRGESRAEDYLIDNGVEHIWFNEMRFGQGRGLPQKKQEVEPEAPQLDELLQRLIQSIRTESEPRKFFALSREASLTAARLMEEKKTEWAFEIIKAFWHCFNCDPPRHAAIAETSRAAFAELMNATMIEHVLRLLTLLDGPRQEEVLGIAKSLDTKFIDAILDKLATNEALYSHRALIQILLSMPEQSRPGIESRLSDARWHVVRKMAFLVGEIANSASATSLIGAANHDDPRVVKEALKALSKVKTPDATRYLLGLLSGKVSDEIKLHVMRLLAATKEVGAVPTLMKLLKERSSLLENLELYQEAVRTLGKIGSQQATPMLEQILHKKSIFAKSRNLALSVEAAEALGYIGGKQAAEALQKGAESKSPEVSAACRKALMVIGGAPAEAQNRNRNQGES